MTSQTNTDGSNTLVAPGVDITTPGSFSANGGTPLPPVSQTQDASAIAKQSTTPTGIQFPTQTSAQDSANSATNANASISAPIPTADNIIDNGAATTPAEAKNTSLLNRVASLIGMGSSQEKLTNDAETAAGVPGLQKIYDDFNTQLEGLNNQATDLQNQTWEGGSLQNQYIEGAKTSDVFGAHSNYIDSLRQNQIQQSAIASQALTVKSALFGAQGKLSLAKDAADKAATAQYAEQQRQIDYTKSLIDANTPQMNKEEKAQAALVTAQLADRQTKIDNAKEDKKTILAMATAALTNNPNDPAAQYAAQQALAESNQQQPDLQKALALVGKYQTDPIATQQAIANLAKTRADIANTNANTDKTKAGTATVNQDGSTTYDALTIRRYNLASNAAIKNYIALPGYSLVANGQAYLSRIDSAMKVPGSVSDQDLLDSITKLNNAGGQVTEAQVNTVLKGASLADKMNVWQKYLTSNGGVLSNAQRQEVSDVAHAVYKGYQTMYQPIYDKVTQNLKDQGIPKQFWNIPDINELSKQAADTSGGTSGGGTSAFDSLANDITPAPNGTDAYIPGSVWASVQDKDGLLAAVKKLGKNLLVQ